MATVETINLPEDLRHALDQAVQAPVEAVDPKLIILFGSYAKGRADEDSDVDLVVVTETEDRWETIRELRRLLEPVLDDWPLDLLVYAPDRWEGVRRLPGLLPREVDEYGVRLYVA
jgi:predicted nucleotidyltransferase